MRRICRYLPLFVLPLVCLQFANAQSGIDFGVGFGGASAPAAKTGLDPTLNPCTLGSAGCQSTPSLSTFMIGVGGDLMLWKRFGVGGEVELRAQQEGLCDLDAAGERRRRAGIHRETAVARHPLRFQRHFPAA